MNVARRLIRVAQILRRSSHNYKNALAATQSINYVGTIAAINKSVVPTSCRFYSQQKTEETVDATAELDSATYERVCAETLDALSDYFDELTENASDLIGTDVAYGDGVLTVNLGQTHGTYVINRQTPNKQIWLSSPTSGPKRFDYVAGKWIYKHSGESLHQLLQLEIGKIIKKQPVDFMQLPYCS
ncbi:frataxin homolog, mitochondrial [Drosophila nasuta]|uniref:frataxin homolog, mitochondrial n=1 Tax=Drosophila nasuta TaxID=42062 RepID=UPI00295EC982|nr:frataxin homolog, mitochondrial [Drosophila nasuta]